MYAYTNTYAINEMTDENIVQTQPWHSMYIGVSSILLGNDIVHKVEPETKETIATNEHNTIGVSSIRLGNDVAHKVETEETKVTDQHNTINKNDDKKNQSDSTSSTNDATSHSIPSIPSIHPLPPPTLRFPKIPTTTFKTKTFNFKMINCVRKFCYIKTMHLEQPNNDECLL